MKQLTSAQIRQMWLDFWKSKGHAVEPSANLIPVNDPTLLWINSGVATLKKYFDGSVIPENPRITNSQKAIRTNYGGITCLIKRPIWEILKLFITLVSLDRTFVFQDTSVSQFVSMKLKHFVVD